LLPDAYVGAPAPYPSRSGRWRGWAARAGVAGLTGAAEIAARVAFALWRTRRRVAIDNILRAGLRADAVAARRLALASFRTVALMVAESVVLRGRLTAEHGGRYVELRLTPEAEALLRAPGLGLLVASAHVGNWEVAARAASLIKPVCAVYRPFNWSWLDRAALGVRSGSNLRLVSRREPDPMRFIRALAAGEIVALMIDQHASKGRVQVGFFGRPAWTTKAPAMLHLTTRAPLVVAWAIRTGPLRYVVEAVGPIEAPRTGDREKDARALTQALTNIVEGVIRQHPEQYMWGHRRWRSRGTP
jgi:KDO2-lipid IV(A) lauroyltransferase